MNDQQIEKMLHGITKLILSQDSEILELRTSVTVLKLAVASLKGTAPEAALSEFRDREQSVLESLPASQKLREVREMLDFFEKHGKSFGKHKARPFVAYCALSRCLLFYPCFEGILTPC